MITGAPLLICGRRGPAFHGLVIPATPPYPLNSVP
jgi:hypothetical protein